MKFTINRILFLGVVISLLPGLIIERVSPGGWLSWLLITVGLVSPILSLVYFLAEVLTLERDRGQPAPPTTGTIVSLLRRRFAVLRLTFVMAIVTLMCWLAVMLVPIWWWATHQPTNVEMAARHRLDAEHWKRLAAENPSLAKEYLRLADRSIISAERRDRSAKGSRP